MGELVLLPHGAAGFRFRVHIAGTAHGAVLRLRLILAAGLIVVYILAPGVGDGLDLSRFHITAVEAGTLLLALCIAGGFLGHFPLAVVMDDLCFFRFTAVITVCNLFAVLAIRGFLGHRIGGVLVGNDTALVHFIYFTTSFALMICVTTMLTGSLLIAVFFAPFVAKYITPIDAGGNCLVGPGGFPVLGQFRQGNGLVLLCHFPVLGQLRQGSGLVLLCHLPILGQFRQCSSFVSLGLGIDIGFVSLRVGFLLLGLGCRGLYLVGVRRQYGSRRGQGKANGQHQSDRTLAQFVDFSHVPSSFNCCRVSGFACRP